MVPSFSEKDYEAAEELAGRVASDGCLHRGLFFCFWSVVNVLEKKKNPTVCYFHSMLFQYHCFHVLFIFSNNFPFCFASAGVFTTVWRQKRNQHWLPFNCFVRCVIVLWFKSNPTNLASVEHSYWTFSYCPKLVVGPIRQYFSQGGKHDHLTANLKYLLGTTTKKKKWK